MEQQEQSIPERVIDEAVVVKEEEKAEEKEKEKKQEEEKEEEEERKQDTELSDQEEHYIKCESEKTSFDDETQVAIESLAKANHKRMDTMESQQSGQSGRRYTSQIIRLSQSPASQELTTRKSIQIDQVTGRGSIMDELAQRFHLLDEDGKLNPDMESFLAKLNVMQRNKDYNMISIIGSQSSGKSTLLNNVFGTCFDMMDLKKKRQQTTKGIWLSRDKEFPLLVMDVEGSDSKERWDSRQSFEQSTALFALCLSQVLIINLWTYQVGNYTGGQYEIIKVILEMNIKLFKRDQLKQLLYVLRDFDQDENLEELTQTIKDDVHKIWNEIPKPEDMKDVPACEVFRLHFYKMSHFKQQKADFMLEAEELHQMFGQGETSLFRDFDYSSNLPVAALGSYSQSIWQSIKENKDINLPTQKTMVANMRCDQIRQQVMSEHQEQLDALVARCKNDLVRSFADEGSELLSQVLEAYDLSASYYVQSVYQEKRGELEREIKMTLHDCFQGQVTQLKKGMRQQYLAEIESNVVGSQEEVETQVSKIQAIGAKVMAENSLLVSRCAEAPFHWEVNGVMGELSSLVEELEQSQKDKVFNGQSTKSLREAVKTLERLVYEAFIQLEPAFWMNLNAALGETVRQALETQDTLYSLVYCSLTVSQVSLLDSQIATYREDLHQVIHSEVQKKFKELDYLLIKKFKSLFSKKSSGTPYNWTSMTPSMIEEVYEKAKGSVNSVAKVVVGQQLSGGWFKDEILSDMDFLSLSGKLTDQMDQQLNEALQKQSHSDKSGMPLYIWPLLAFFFYDYLSRWLQHSVFQNILFLLALAGFLAMTFGKAFIVSFVQKQIAATAVSAVTKSSGTPQ